ncbi:MAG: UMP kinase [Asgard group archaeon]|nr:UMP kinase [Asgard group archaeon]
MFVVKIGGSILYKDKSKLNTKLISEYVKTLRSIFTKNQRRFVIVIGGGNLAREVIATARKIDASEANCDLLGIEAAKLHARIFISGLGELAYPHPPESLQDFMKAYTSCSKIIVCGGFQPGQSTNAVASVIAETINARQIYNLTDVDGVYSADPDKEPDATLLSEITIDKFRDILLSYETKAGDYPLFDFTAYQIIKRSKIPIQFLNGLSVTNLQQAIAGKSLGTKVTH